MADESDQLGVSIAGAIDLANNSGSLSLQTKSRFLAAADRLLGALLDWPGSWIDTCSERSKTEAKIKREFREHQAWLAQKALERGAEHEARILQLQAVAEFRELERTLNLAAVVGEAANLLTDSSGQPNDEDVTQGKNESAEPVDHDWLNRFRLYASEATSDHLREIWARILQGETQKPGQFSASALRFIFEMDRSLADCCELISKITSNDCVYYKDEDRSGLTLDSALTLQACGLMTGVGDTLSQQFTFSGDGKYKYLCGDILLLIDGEPNQIFNINAWFMTKLGLQIFSLLEAPDNYANLKYLAEKISKMNVSSVKLLKLGKQVGEDTREVLNTEIIK
jgi:hypothetical protein